MSIIIDKLHLIWIYVVLSFRNYIQFPVEFFMNFLMVFFDVFAVFLFWLSLSSLQIGISNWNENDLLIFVGMSILSEAVSKILFGFRDIEYFIIDGSFDKFLIRPQNPIFSMLMEKLNVFVIVSKTVIGTATLFYVKIMRGVAFRHFYPALVICVLGTLSYELLYGTFSLLAFWFGKIYNARSIVFSFQTIRKYPLDIFPNTVKNLFTYIIPLALVATVPSQIITGKIQMQYSFLCIAVLSFSVSLLIFYLAQKRALKRYSSTGC